MKKQCFHDSKRIVLTFQGKFNKVENVKKVVNPNNTGREGN